jgi:hypothetical protein
MHIGALSQSIEKVLRIFSKRVMAETRNWPLEALQTGNNVTDEFLGVNFLLLVLTHFPYLFTFVKLSAFKNRTKIVEIRNLMVGASETDSSLANQLSDSNFLQVVNINFLRICDG